MDAESAMELAMLTVRVSTLSEVADSAPLGAAYSREEEADVADGVRVRRSSSDKASVIFPPRVCMRASFMLFVCRRACCLLVRGEHCGGAGR
jgi:hypothetical protein